MNKDIYELKLHEATTSHKGNSYTKIVRVPGGWIYFYSDDMHKNLTSTFVPFSRKSPKLTEE
ncbi:MAG: hypothetical protein CMF34_01915 [Leeuwenhoekiella sp.]|nr:hypothetical protein [Leeuwenhoekiella sp.]MBH13582.1 hypothetical protein [Leeuwenhoekiella sp.]HAX15730.1 hypothetical protein [Leeuwenhoekiella sp.]|tara:strand:+ start:13113 stop:13298 length:186 start_codon:yes stop_codon:yes gene_type:complete